MPDIDATTPVSPFLRPLGKLSGRFRFPPRNTLRGAFSLLIWEGSFASAFMVLTSGGLVIALAKLLNADNWQLSLLSAMLFLVMPFQTWLGVHFNKAPIRKQVTIITAFLYRILWLAPVILVWWQPPNAIGWLLFFVFLQFVAFTISSLCWLSWVGEIVTTDLRERFFGARQRAASIANVIFFLMGGWLLDRARENGDERMGHVFIGLGAIMLGLISVYLLNKVPPTLRPHKQNTVIEDRAAKPWSDHVFRRIMIGFGAWYFAIGLAGPYWAVHMLTYLKFSFLGFTSYGAFFTLTMAVMSPMAARWIEKHGDFRIASIGMLCLSSVPIYWLFITPTFWYPIIPEIIITSIGWSAVQLTQSTLALRFSTPENRNRYLAAQSMAIGIGFTIGAVIGGPLMDVCKGATGILFGNILYPTHFAFAVTGLIRWLVASYLFTLRGLDRNS